MDGFTMKGPLFDGRAEQAMNSFARAAEDHVAKDGVNKVQERLGEVIRHNTGYYESQIQTDRVTEGASINDGGVVYGPWLEGTGSRNRTTRFKGYSTFRLMTQKIQAEAAHRAEEVLHPYLERMR